MRYDARCNGHRNPIPDCSTFPLPKRLLERFSKPLRKRLLRPLLRPLPKRLPYLALESVHRSYWRPLDLRIFLRPI